MRKLRIKGWAEYQHYTDRDPKWIKLHVRILTSEDWVMLDDASKLLAVVCMVLAAGRKGEVPDNPDYIKRVAFLNKRPNLTPLIECGFLEILQANDTECPQMRANGTECLPREDKKREEKNRSITADEESAYETFWQAFPRKVGKGHARKIFLAVLRSQRATAQELTDAAKRYAAERANEPIKFTKHPATWLNGECWKDEPDTPAEPTATSQWERRYLDWKAGGSWLPKWGPEPGEPGCYVPQEVIEKAA